MARISEKFPNLRIRGFFLFAYELAVFGVYFYYMAGLHIAGQDGLCNKRFNACLQVTLERSCTEHGVKATLDNELLCSVGYFKAEGLVGKTLLEGSGEDVDNAVKLCLGKRLKADYLVKTVKKLRSE